MPSKVTETRLADPSEYEAIDRLIDDAYAHDYGPSDHRDEMRFARDVGTKLVFMHMGKVHEEGAPRELFAHPKTPELQNFIGSVH